MEISITKSTRLAAVLGASCIASSASLAATIEVDEDSWVSVGAGMRAGFTSVEDATSTGEDSNSYGVQNVRLYVGGQVNEQVKFTFNTECEGCTFGQDTDIGAGGDMVVLDAIAQFELSPLLNIWVGRMLTPADRIEMNGPFYGLSWNQYTVPLLPSDQLGQAGLFGRDDGVTLWGAASKFQYALGLFDGVDGGPNQDDNPLFAMRLAYNFLDQESNPAYYTSSTYFGGGGHIFTVALSFQSQADGTGTAALPADFEATIVDFLYEQPLGGGAAVTFEGEYKMFDAPLTLGAVGDPDCFCLFDGDSYFLTAAYLLPGAGTVRYQPYLRFVSNEPDATPHSDLTEFGINFVLSGHNARLNFNYTSGDANITGLQGADRDAIFFGVQIQI
jgi:hypothetical protein